MTPEKILQDIYERAEANLDTSVISDQTIRERINYICRCMSNRAGIRLLMSCLLGKLHRPNVDPRKPYREIEGTGSFSGRTYDERYLTPFIHAHRLPVNSTTAFLTPTLRNIAHPLTLEYELIGRPRELYRKMLEILDDVVNQRIEADSVLVETVRILLVLRNEKLFRINSLLAALEHSGDALPLASETIVTLLGQHLACKNASRLPVLVVAAAYHVAGTQLGEHMRALHSHNAADLQTGALGDLEICVAGEDEVVTVYEMKRKRVTQHDIEAAVTKISRATSKIDNYLFVTTEPVDPVVVEYATAFYEKMEGTEIAILDCIGFLRHFLHLFHRIRMDYLDAYQTLVLNEPDSAISQTLKEAFLALRQTAESGE